MRKVLMYLVLLLVSLSLVSASYNIDENNLKNPQEQSEKIVITSTSSGFNLFDLFKTQVIYVNKGNFNSGETARFTFEQVSWAVWCRNPGEVVELYSPNGFVKSFYRTGLNNPGGSNMKYSGYFDYTISADAPKGSWGLADYLWCFDSDYPTLNPQKFGNYNRRISNVGTASFQVGSLACDRNYNIIVNDWSSCSSGKQSRLVRNGCGDSITQVRECTTSTCKPNWQCQDWGVCSLGTQTRTCNDANSCNLVVNSPVTTQSCGTVTPPVIPPTNDPNTPTGDTDGDSLTPPSGFLGLTTLQIGIIAILLFTIIAIAFMRKR